jgi:hypothetical protein
LELICSFNPVDEYLNNRQKEIFHNLLANPADTGSAYVNSLQELVRSYPQSGLFHALYSRAVNDKNPGAAGAYFDSRILHKLYHQPDSLLEVAGSHIVWQPESIVAIVEVKEQYAEPVAKQQPVAVPDVAAPALQDQPIDFPEILNVSWPNNAEAEVKQAEEIKEETTPASITTEPAVHQEALIEQATVSAIEEQPINPPAAVTVATNIEDEIFDEITGIDDIEIVQNPVEISDAPVAPQEALVEQADEMQIAAAPQPIRDEAERLILGNIAATDYFVFNKAFSDNGKTPTETTATTPPAEPAAQPQIQSRFVATPQQTEPVAEENTHQDVSKYHDEKMPYTFTWWLDKTRKEHGSLYQPYVKAPVNNTTSVAKPVNDALQQQYFENIFHISSVDDLEKDAAAQTIEFDMQSKEDRIIARFITEDPQIHPPVGEKLDTENKARKSSEDNNEMVTETLARIYADQMLYPKAIATYKKLMLKFPEKSRYFASRIENLEKKTN